MYEKDSQRIQTARVAASSDPAVRVWTAASVDDLAVQAVALMNHAALPLPPGTVHDLVALAMPRGTPTGIDTEFRPWSQHEAATFHYHSVGELILGDSVGATAIHRTYPGATDNEVRRF